MYRLTLGVVFSLCILGQGCKTSDGPADSNQFSSSQDTIVLQTEKVKGSGLFSLGAGSLTFREIDELFEYPVVFPKHISNIEGIQMSVDFAAAEPDYIDIIRGDLDSQQVFVVDQNNNKDFTDDSVRVFEKMDWKSSKNSIECQFSIKSGNKVVIDTSWVKIGVQGDKLYYGRDEHLTADFSVDDTRYTVGVIDQVFALTFTYGADPEMALLASNAEPLDTLFRRDFIKRNEYLDLGGQYYRFDSITHDGKYISLVREQNFDQKIGTQVGMLAPDFECLTTTGDTINSVRLKEKPIVLANSCGCGGDTLSTASFYEIKNKFKDRIHAIRLDSGMGNEKDGWHVDAQSKDNKDIYDKYRKMYCSRVAFLIGVDGRIAEKFDIVDWKSALGDVIF